MKTTTYKLRTAFLIMAFAFLSQMRAQEPCGHSMAQEYFMSTDPDYISNSNETEERIKNFIANQSQNRMSNGIIDIPVVVHVLHIGEAVGTGSNISDATILSAIQGMNDKYKGTNGFGVDMQINFCLAVRDPNGNPTTGINRVNGSGVTNYVSNGIFALQGVSPGTCFNNSNAMKDLSKWPTASYLNIWVVYKYCLSSGSLYGQASGQTGSAYDGVTILYSQMTQSSITLAHEVGHMLLLNHTFLGDAGGASCPADTSCANNGDLVCDTPPHKMNDWGAANPCSAFGVWDNSRYNFMAYSWASGPVGTFNATTCRFTQGQKDRARAAIYALTTHNYLNSTACVPAVAVDAGVNRIVYPVKTTYTSNCSFPNMLAPVVQLKNYGLNTLTSATINYKIDNGAYSNYNWSGTLLKDSLIDITLPGISVGSGNHTFIAYSNNPNGTADVYAYNDSADVAMTYVFNQTSNITLSTSLVDPICNGGNNGSASVSASSSPYKFTSIENFEGATTDWIIINGSEVNHWLIGSATASTGNKSIYVTADNSTNAYTVNASSSVHLYKDFYFPAGATNIKIKFDWKTQGEPGGFNGVDRLRVYLVAPTQNPSPGYQLGVVPQYTVTSIGSYYSQATFRTDSITGLDANAGTVKRIVFNWRNNSAGGTQSPAALDNIIVTYDLPGTPSYTYSWNSTPVQTTAAATGLSANNYTVTVSNENNCVSTASVILSDPAAITANVTASDTAICPGDSAVLTSTTASTYLWSNGGTSQTLTVYSAGSYSVTINDANGCSATSSGTNITLLPVGNCAIGIKTNEAKPMFTVFPNPANDYISIKSSDLENGNYKMTISNELGQILLNQNFGIQNSNLSQNIRVVDLAVGLYFLTIESDNSKTTIKFSKEN